MELPSLPFVIPSVYEGLATARGMARLSPAALILEFEVKDSIVGVIKTGVREVQVPIEEIHRLDLRKGWFRTRLLIRAHRMMTFDKVPGQKSGTIELRVAREDRSVAEALVSTLKLRLSERELAQITSGMGA